jgi:hypothetical protein
LAGIGVSLLFASNNLLAVPVSRFFSGNPLNPIRDLGSEIVSSGPENEKQQNNGGKN